MSATRAPRVSVLMTVFNAEAFLRPSVECVLAQTFADWELIAIDDGSTDSSRAILASYVDERIRIVPLAKNIGRTPALRHAFDLARGDLIAVLDADDLCAPERFARQVQFLDAHAEVALVGSWTRYIDERGVPFGEFRPPVAGHELHDRLGWENPIVHSSAMYRRSMAAAVGGYSLDLAYAQDFGLVLALAERHRIAMLGEFLCDWRIVAGSMTRSPRYGIARGSESVMNFGRASRLPLSRTARRLNRRARAVAKVELGIALLRYESVPRGIGSIAQGLWSDPTVAWGNSVVRGWLARFRAAPGIGEKTSPS